MKMKNENLNSDLNSHVYQYNIKFGHKIDFYYLKIITLIKKTDKRLLIIDY